MILASAKFHTPEASGKSRSRALRRHHRRRLIARVKLLLPTVPMPQIRARTRHPCSKWCCRNRRQDMGPKLQERREADRERDYARLLD
jgi:hypothetical protein